MRKLEGLNPDFADVLRALAEAEAAFVVVGAYALAVHGFPRATGDIDIFVRADAANAARVHRALESFGAPLASAGVTVDDFTKPDTVYQIGIPPRRINILTSISGVTFDEARTDAVCLELDDTVVPFIGRAALIRNKRSTGRPKDELDARDLEDTSSDYARAPAVASRPRSAPDQPPHRFDTNGQEHRQEDQARAQDQEEHLQPLEEGAEGRPRRPRRHHPGPALLGEPDNYGTRRCCWSSLTHSCSSSSSRWADGSSPSSD